MIDTVDDLIVRARALSFSDQLLLLEKLAAEIREKQLSWKEFIQLTAGSLADDPIERPPQGEFEERDEIL